MPSLATCSCLRCPVRLSQSSEQGLGRGGCYYRGVFFPSTKFFLKTDLFVSQDSSEDLMIVMDREKNLDKIFGLCVQGIHRTTKSSCGCYSHPDVQPVRLLSVCICSFLPQLGGKIGNHHTLPHLYLQSSLTYNF